MTLEVKNLQELISEHLGAHKKIISSEVSRLTAPGENYLSVVVKIDLVLKNEETNSEEKLHAVGKCIHSDDVHEELKNFGKENYNSELAFYNYILPTLQKFAKKQGLKKNYDIFPKLIAFRPNLHGNNNEVDEHSILLMENMIVNGK